MKTLLSIFAVLLTLADLFGQGFVTIVIDSKLIGTIIVNHAVTMEALRPMAMATEDIRAYQEEIAKKTLIMRGIKDLIYNSMKEVPAVVKGGKNVLAAKRLVREIGEYQVQIVRYARGNPALTALAFKTESALVSRSAALMTYIFENALVGGDQNLINGRQRMEIIRHVVNELRVMRAMAFEVFRRMKTASRAGAIGSGPFGLPYPDKDGPIVENILNSL